MSNKKIDQPLIMKAMDWAYDKAINGIPGLDSAQEMGEDFLRGNKSLKSKANSLIRYQNAKAGTSGFISGLGGLITMPVMIPANITIVLYVQIRMIAAIAHMGGHDLKDDKVKTLVYACIAGNAVKDILKNTGIVIGQKLTTQGIKNITREVIVKINQAVGFKLLTKFGEKGVINLGKAIPLVGGIVGGTFDLVTTNTIGNIARNIFITD